MGFSKFREGLKEEDRDYLHVGLVVNLQLIGPSITRICFFVLSLCLFNVLPVSDSIRDEGYFDRTKVVNIVCVVVYFELEKFWCFIGTIQKMHAYVS